MAAIRYGIWFAASMKFLLPLDLLMGVGAKIAVPILCTRTLLEPGVCGVIQPVLLLPAAILDHLSEEQLQAIVAHEMCHVRRHDNLLYVFLLVVETLFWFHPLVWWLGRRLLEERERACDEPTVLAGNDAAVHAQGILNICRCCLRSAPAWVAGISGADLKNRVTRIVKGDIGKRLSLSRIALLWAVGILVIAVPLGIGAVSGAQDAVGKASVARLHFEVATIKPGQPSPRGSGFFYRWATSRCSRYEAGACDRVCVWAAAGSDYRCACLDGQENI